MNGKGDSSSCGAHYQSCMHDVTRKIVVLSITGNRKMALFQYFVDFFFTQNVSDLGSSSGSRKFVFKSTRFKKNSDLSLLIFAFEKCLRSRPD